MDNAVDNHPEDGPGDDLGGGVGGDLGDDPDDADERPPDDLALEVLRGARANARPNVRRSSKAGRDRNRRDNLAGRNGRNTPGYSGPGADPARDPHRLGALLGGFVEDQGWQRPLAEARVFAEWSSLVGDDIAAHAHPQSLVTGELRIAAESTAWATQLRLLSARILARLVAELGPEVVTRLHISGPAAPSWRHGARSVRGHRGPRDTYG